MVQRIFLVKVKEEKNGGSTAFSINEVMRPPKFGSERILFKLLAGSAKGPKKSELL